MISTDVPPNVIENGITPCNSIGSIAIAAKNTAPKLVIYFSTFDMYSDVFFPALIPGINPPFSLIDLIFQLDLL